MLSSIWQNFLFSIWWSFTSHKASLQKCHQSNIEQYCVQYTVRVCRWLFIVHTLYSSVECGNLFWSVSTGQLTKGQVWFQKFKAKFSACGHVACASKFWFFLIPKGPKFQIRKTVFLVFKENPPKEMFLHLSALIQLLKQ